jgi:AcrR family transcriptional regulator
VAAASALLDEHPERDLSMTDLAQRMGIRTPTLYHHVGGANALRYAVRLAALDALAAELRRAIDAEPPAARLRAALRAYRAFVKQHPGTYALTVRALEGADPAQAERERALFAALRDALAPYHVPETAFVTTARGLRSFVHGFATLEVAGGFGLPEDVDASFEGLIDAIEQQLSAGPPSRR